MGILEALLVLLGASDPAPAECQANRLAIVLTPTTALTSRELQRVRTEVDRIWRPHGLEIVWRSEWFDASEVRQVAVSWVDRIDANGESEKHALGAVVFDVATDRPGPILVSLPHLERLIASVRVPGFAPDQRPAALRRIWLTRALGRILAHEVGHIVLRLHGHRRVGLMKAQFRTDEILDPARNRFGLVEQDRNWSSAGCAG
jgi:hypothetical protein